MLNRNEVINNIAEYFEVQPYVYALWQGGSAAFNRNDAWSDIDLCADVADGHADDVMQLMNRFLEEQYGIELKFEIKQSPWEGMTQTFFRLKNGGPFLLIDFAIFNHSAPDKLLQREIHGQPVILFDKREVLKPTPIDVMQLNKTLQGRLQMHAARFELFRVMIEKELLRGNALDAMAFYLGFTLQPLVEVLRIQHSPYHYNFGLRYTKIDLPADVAVEIEKLYFVANAADLEQKWNYAKQWFAKALKQAEEKVGQNLKTL